ncbi:MAG TPA: ATP-binding protein, partial [Myxococcota bacterium]|nr:ATP-binding protein [Myxococcota bacterium]
VDPDELDRAFADIVRTQTLVARVRLGIIVGFLTVIAITAVFLARHLRAEEKRRDELMALASRELEVLSAPRGAHTAQVDLAQLTRDCAALVQQVNPGRTVDLSVNGEMRADVDPGLARLLVEALLKHAWKVTAGAAAPRVEVGSLTTAGQQCYFVRNNGQRLDAGTAKTLFTSHTGFGTLRADRAELGTAQRVVRRCGGRIWAESLPGDGVTISFTLPAPQNRSS